MRIVFILASLGAGGAEKVISLAAADRCRRGDEVHIVYFGDTVQSFFPQHPDVVIHNIPDGKKGMILPKGLTRSLGRIVHLRRVLKSLQPDLVISFLTKINLLTLTACLRLPYKVLVSERNNPDAQAKNVLWRIISPILMKRADGLVMQTEAIAKTLPGNLRARAVVIGNPCTAAGAAGNEIAAKRSIVAVGRLERQKGFDMLIEAFAAIATSFPQWSLTIYGEGPERQRLESQIRLHALDGRVGLPGVTAEPGAWTQDAGIFVLSSRFEGFPNVLVEAMAAGLPSVAMDCDYGPREIIEDGLTGLLVADQDVTALGEALSHLMADDSLRALMSKQAQAAAGRHSIHAVMEKWDGAILRFAKGPESSNGG